MEYVEIPSSRIIVERTLMRDGLNIMIRIVQPDMPDIRMFGAADSVARLAKSLGIHHIDIYAHTDIPAALSGNEYARAGFAVSRNWNTINPRYDTAIDFAAEMLSTLAQDNNGKRGRKFIPHIRIWDSYNDTIARETGREIGGKKLLED